MDYDMKGRMGMAEGCLYCDEWPFMGPLPLTKKKNNKEQMKKKKKKEEQHAAMVRSRSVFSFRSSHRSCLVHPFPKSIAVATFGFRIAPSIHSSILP